jgi:hypothetical protein
MIIPEKKITQKVGATYHTTYSDKLGTFYIVSIVVPMSKNKKITMCESTYLYLHT